MPPNYVLSTILPAFYLLVTLEKTCPLIQQFTSFYLSCPYLPESPRKKPNMVAASKFKKKPQ